MENKNMRKPKWLHKKMDFKSMQEMNKILRSLNLHTVCEGARCPNMSECFNARTATFMILGDICTRNCKFCAIPKGKPTPIDIDEPANIVAAVKQLNLKHIVITSVTRDDIQDGGASQFAACIYKLKQEIPSASIEVLIPDFQGNKQSLDIVINANPDIINHNVETVPELYNVARQMANYKQSLDVLQYIKEKDNNIYTKSGIMLGIGETKEQVISLFKDLRAVLCDMLTIGQYLQPSHNHLAIKEYVEPVIFDEYKQIALDLGFKFVASGSYVRSSFNASNDFTNFKNNVLK